MGAASWKNLVNKVCGLFLSRNLESTNLEVKNLKISFFLKISNQANLYCTVIFLCTAVEGTSKFSRYMESFTRRALCEE
jgi:hypothetical protein